MDAVKEAIKWGIAQDVLGKFLAEHGMEVSNMIPGTTFNIDIAKEVWQEEAREDGYEEGLAEARKEFQARIDALEAEKEEQAAEIEKLKLRQETKE